MNKTSKMFVKYKVQVLLKKNTNSFFACGLHGVASKYLHDISVTLPQHLCDAVTSARRVVTDERNKNKQMNLEGSVHVQIRQQLLYFRNDLPFPGFRSYFNNLNVLISFNFILTIEWRNNMCLVVNRKKKHYVSIAKFTQIIT